MGEAEAERGTLALPKSQSLSWWVAVLTNRFWGLMSRWQMPFWWMWCSDLATDTTAVTVGQQGLSYQQTVGLVHGVIVWTLAVGCITDSGQDKKCRPLHGYAQAEGDPAVLSFDIKLLIRCLYCLETGSMHLNQPTTPTVPASPTQDLMISSYHTL